MDCANGVGAEKLKALSERLSGKLEVDLRNTGDGGLNDMCGADWVQKERHFPTGCGNGENGARSALQAPLILSCICCGCRRLVLV